MSAHRQQGFSVVEIVLIIVVVFLLGAVGYLFYQNTQKDTKASQAANTTLDSKSDAEDTDKQAADKVAADATYTAKDGSYSLKFPNGWELFYSDVAIYGGPVTNKTGAATFTAAASGKDAGGPFKLLYSLQADDNFDNIKKAGPIAAKSVTGTKYTEAGQGMGDLEPNTITYHYYFVKNDHSVWVTYAHEPSKPNLSADVEKILTTLEFK